MSRVHRSLQPYAVSKGWLPLTDVLVFSLLAGTFATLASGYVFGEINQVGQLPLIYRAMDPAYLGNDFFVNAGKQFNPRAYYVGLLATLGRVVPLEVLFLVLTCLANASLALVTWYIARAMSGESDTSAMLSAALVLVVSGFHEGGAAHIPRAFLEPSLLARPLAMLGLWLSLTRRHLWGAPLFVGAILIHPLVGAETVAIALGVTIVLAVMEAYRQCPGSRRDQLKELATAVILGIALVAATWTLWHGGYEQTLDGRRFVHILAETRTPHHQLPSRFGWGSHLAFVIFCLAFLISWLEWRGSVGAGRHRANGVIGVFLAVLVLCVGGYLFVEVLPTRVGATAQVFRTTFLIKWFGFLLFACAAGRVIRERDDLVDATPGYLMVLGVGRFQPAVSLLGHLFEAVRRRFLGGQRGLVTRSMAVSILACATPVLLMPLNRAGAEPFSLLVVVAVGAWFLFTKRAWVRRVVPVLVLGSAASLLIVFRSSDTVKTLAGLVGVQTPRISMYDSVHPWTDAARFARGHTPSEAVFLTPPDLGGFRLVAKRAIVVDFKSFPFQDAAMEEWYERMLFTYGQVTDTTLPELGALEAAYGEITDERVLRVAAKYGATYALLWSETPTGMPVVYNDRRFKIVLIGSVRSS
ncbi:MAG: DUF6798 domain-containing protein [Acidobacteriota bacterium]